MGHGLGRAHVHAAAAPHASHHAGHVPALAVLEPADAGLGHAAPVVAHVLLEALAVLGGHVEEGLALVGRHLVPQVRHEHGQQLLAGLGVGVGVKLQQLRRNRRVRVRQQDKVQMCMRL